MGETMNALLWVLQALLAVAFFAHGWILLVPPASLMEAMAPIPIAFRIFLGLAEMAAAVGLTLPGLSGIQTWWTSFAALGIMIVMISATVFHMSRGEAGAAMTTIGLLIIATFVAYMRWKVKPIRSRARA